MNRRHFLRAAVYSTAAAGPLVATGYGFAESGAVRVDRKVVTIPRLPSGFDGLRVAFLSDIHVGPYLSPEFVTTVVRTTLALDPDLILLGGDYVLRDAKYAGPCFDVLAALKAPLGVYGVLGNHDYWHGVEKVKDGMKAAKVVELTNRGVWLERHGERLRVAGVDDLWKGEPRIGSAIGDARPTDACILVSHNPDVAELVADRTVKLMVSGHTHGGQVVIPEVGAPWIPSRYGMKYARGLVEAPATQVYVSTGVGMSGIPLRMNCRPEIGCLTLRCA